MTHRHSKEEKSSKGSHGSLISKMRGRKNSKESGDATKNPDPMADRRRPKRESSPLGDRRRSSKNMARSRSQSLNPTRPVLSARGSMRHVPPQLAPIQNTPPGSAPSPQHMNAAPGLSVWMSPEQVQRLLQLPVLPTLYGPDGQALLMPPFPFPIPQELMPEMMKHFQPAPMIQNLSPNRSASPSGTGASATQPPSMQRTASILQQTSSFKRPKGDANVAGSGSPLTLPPPQVGRSILQNKSSFKRPANPPASSASPPGDSGGAAVAFPSAPNSESDAALTPAMKASGGLERVASKRVVDNSVDARGQSSSILSQNSKFKPQLSEEEEAERKKAEEERLQHQRTTEYVRAKNEQIVRETMIEGRIAAERHRQAEDIQKGVAGRHFFNSVAEASQKEPEKSSAVHPTEPEDLIEEPVQAEVPPAANASQPAAAPQTEKAEKTHEEPASVASSKAASDYSVRPESYHPATLVLYEKKLMVGRKRNTKEDELNYPVKLYGERGTDVRVTKEDESIEKFHVDELVTHRKGSTYVESKIMNNLLNIFMSGRRTAVLNIDNSTLTSVPPFETPSWFAVQGLLDTIAGKVSSLRDEGAHVEFHLSFAAVKLRSSKMTQVRYERGKAYEMIDLLAEGSQEPIPYNQKSDIVYGDRLAGVTYRKVVTREAFLKTFLFAQTAANYVNDGLNSKLAVNKDDENLQKEKDSLMYIVTGVLTKTTIGTPIVATVPEKDEKVDLSRSDIISDVPTEEFHAHESKSTESDRVINVLTCVGIEHRFGLCEEVLPGKGEGGVPLVRDLLESPSYVSVITSVDPQDAASVVPLALTAKLGELSLPPPQSGSLRRLMGRARSNIAAAHEGIKNTRPGSEVQHAHKLLMKKETAALKAYAPKLDEPLERRLSIMDNDV